MRRRRARSGEPRRRQVVLRFSDAELELVRERARLAGMAVGAWIGQVALDVARGSDAVGLPDLLRLHADVVAVERAAAASGGDHAKQVVGLLARLDAVIDLVVAAAGPTR